MSKLGDTAGRMSEENVATARELYPSGVDLAVAFSDAGFLKELRPIFHSDFEAVFEARNIPMGPAAVDADETRQPTVLGFDALIGAWREWLSAWDKWVITPTDFLEVDDERVLVLMRVDARSMTHEVEMPIDGANILTIRDGKLSHLQMFLDQSEALEAAGLQK